MRCQMMTTVKLINTSITSHKLPLLCMCVCIWWECLGSTLSTFQVHGKVLLTEITPLYISSPELNHLVTENVYPLTSISLSAPLSTSLAATTLLFASLSLAFIESTDK